MLTAFRDVLDTAHLNAIGELVRSGLGDVLDAGHRHFQRKQLDLVGAHLTVVHDAQGLHADGQLVGADGTDVLDTGWGQLGHMRNHVRAEDRIGRADALHLDGHLEAMFAYDGQVDEARDVNARILVDTGDEVVSETIFVINAYKMQSKINSRSTASTLIEKTSRADLNLASKNCCVPNGALIDQTPCLYPLVHLMGAEGIIVDDGRSRDLIARLQGVEAQQRRVLDAGDRYLGIDLMAAQQAHVGDASGLQDMAYGMGTKEGGVQQARRLDEGLDVVVAQHRDVLDGGGLGKLDDRMPAQSIIIDDGRRVDGLQRKGDRVGTELVDVRDRRHRQGFGDRAGVEAGKAGRRGIGESCSTEVGRQLVPDVLGLDGRVEADAGLAG